LAAVALQECALSTSGSTGDFFEVAGRRYSHMIDPRSGWPAQGTLAVSVLAGSATDSDALSTAFFIMGPDETKRYCAIDPEITATVLPCPPPGQEVKMVRFGIGFE